MFCRSVFVFFLLAIVLSVLRYLISLVSNNRKCSCRYDYFHDSHVDKNAFDYLKPDKPKAGRFYLLLKINKVNNHPGRPLVSANGHPTEKIQEFVDFHLRPHVEAVPSHLKDTTDYLQKMESMNPLPSGTILVSMDVTSLYTNIPHNDGIGVCQEAWDLRALKNHQRNVLSSCSHWY